jgi:hypothetical protein
MKAYTISALTILVLVLTAAVLFQYRENAIDARDEMARVLSVETYVAQHITELSPEKAVLGGTFYVTEVSAKDGMGTVMYEDGHIALVADFSYTLSDTSGIHITSFSVRK